MIVCTQNNWKNNLGKLISPLIVKPTLGSPTQFSTSKLTDINATAILINNSIEDSNDDLELLSRCFDLFTTIGFYNDVEKHFAVKDHYLSSAIMKLMKFTGVNSASKLYLELENLLIEYSALSTMDEINKELRILSSKLFILKFIKISHGRKTPDDVFSYYNALTEKLHKFSNKLGEYLMYGLSDIDKDGFEFFINRSHLPFNDNVEIIQFQDEYFSPIISSLISNVGMGALFLIFCSDAKYNEDHLSELLNRTPKNQSGYVLSDRPQTEKQNKITHVRYRKINGFNFSDVIRGVMRNDPCFIIFDIDGFSLNQNGLNVIVQMVEMGVHVILYVNSFHGWVSKKSYLNQFNLDEYIASTIQSLVLPTIRSNKDFCRD